MQRLGVSFVAATHPRNGLVVVETIVVVVCVVVEVVVVDGLMVVGGVVMVVTVSLEHEELFVHLPSLMMQLIQLRYGLTRVNGLGNVESF